MKPLNFEADVISGLDDLREQFPEVPTTTRILPDGDVEQIDAGTALDDPLFSYLPRTGKGSSLATVAERDELRKFLCGDDFDDLPPATAQPVTLTQRIAQIVSKNVDSVFGKVQHINASAPARKARLGEILGEAKQKLIAKGYAADGGDGWSKLEQSCHAVITGILMEV